MTHLLLKPAFGCDLECFALFFVVIRALGGAVALQTGRSWFWFPMVPLEFSLP